MKGSINGSIKALSRLYQAAITALLAVLRRAVGRKGKERKKKKNDTPPTHPTHCNTWRNLLVPREHLQQQNKNKKSLTTTLFWGAIPCSDIKTNLYPPAFIALPFFVCLRMCVCERERGNSRTCKLSYLSEGLARTLVGVKGKARVV
jgi:hypothetical protein